jgi:hypothetical protein
MAQKLPPLRFKVRGPHAKVVQIAARQGARICGAGKPFQPRGADSSRIVRTYLLAAYTRPNAAQFHAAGIPVYNTWENRNA